MAKRKKRVAQPPNLDDIVGAVAADVAQAVGKDDAVDGETVQWARDCYEVSKLLHDKRPTMAKAGSPFRFALWKHGLENIDTFVLQMMPKAMAILDRHMAKNVDDSTLEREESKAIAELQRILRGAIEEALDELD